MKTLKNILLAIATIASMYLVCADPFGTATANQYTCNAIIFLIVFPTLIVGAIKVNPELFSGRFFQFK